MKRPIVPGALLLALLLVPTNSAHAQEEQRPLLSLAPVVGPTWSGHRWELEGNAPSPSGQPVEVTLGPTAGLELGLAAELQPWQRVGLVFIGSWTSLEAVRVAKSGNSPDQRNVAGDQSLLRLSGGVRYRIVARAPGYFSAGVVVNRFQVGPARLVTAHEDRTEFGGFGGIGLDFGSGSRHIRAEGRIMVVSPGADPLTPVSDTGTYQPRSTVLDYSLNLSLVFGL